MTSGKAITLLTLILSAGTLVAQQVPQSQATGNDASQTQMTAGRHPGRMNPDKQAKHLAKKLSLTKEQVAQIKPLLAERQSAMQGLRADTTLSAQDRHAKARAIQQDAQSKIEAVLNDSQKQQFEQMIAARHARHSQKHAS